MLNRFLLKSGDFLDDNGVPRLLEKGLLKVKRANEELRMLDAHKNERRSSVDASLVDVLYATSDIHADLAALMGLMRSSGLIKLAHARASLDAVLGAVWLPHRTYFVVVGDLVDGRRLDGAENHDPDGTFELLVHVLLFNMRILARERASDVVITFGNHDVTSVLDRHTGRLDGFIHGEAWRYWDACLTQQANKTKGLPVPDPACTCSRCQRAGVRTKDMRRRVLRPFYECSPFLTFNVVSKSPTTGRYTPEVSFVHGAFHADNHIAKISQGALRAGALFPNVREATESVALDMDNLFAHQVVSAALDSRRYQEVPSECMGTGMAAKLVVVGHCPTTAMDGDMKDATCGGHGACVVLRYRDGLGVRCDTIVALVDTGMSGCMRNPNLTAPPVIHMLKLTHVEFARTMLTKMQQKAPGLYAHTLLPDRFGAVLKTALDGRPCATDIPPIPAHGTPHGLATRSFAISRVLVDTSLASHAAGAAHVCTHGFPATRGPNHEFLACTTCNEELRHWL
jgi:hypothetical protein